VAVERAGAQLRSAEYLRDTDGADSLLADDVRGGGQYRDTHAWVGVELLTPAAASGFHQAVASYVVRYSLKASRTCSAVNP
jgi:hypothetical protein